MELFRSRLLPPTPNNALLCDNGSPLNVFEYPNPNPQGIRIRKIVRNIVGADGLIGEYGFWLARQGEFPKMFWDDGETVMQNVPGMMPQRVFDCGDSWITIPPGIGITYQVQGQLLDRMRQMGNYPAPANHWFVPEIILWYNLIP